MASSAINGSVLSQTLADAGLEDNEDNREQLRVMLEAMCIYEEREASRGGLWKEMGAKDSAHHLKSKAMRIDYTARNALLLRGEDRAIDEALDAVNYAVFYARNVRADRFGD